MKNKKISPEVVKTVQQAMDKAIGLTSKVKDITKNTIELDYFSPTGLYLGGISVSHYEGEEGWSISGHSHFFADPAKKELNTAVKAIVVSN